MPRYIGLDVHQRYLHACEFRPDLPEGQQERHFRFPNTPEAWKALVAELDREAVVALEVTGNAFEIHDILLPHAGKVLLANPAELKRLGSGRHTDRADAARLAKMAALGIVPAVWVPPQPLRPVRRLLKTRERLDSQRRALLNQARAALGRHGILVPRGADPAFLLERVEGMPLPPGERLAVEVTLEAAQVLEAQVEVLTAEIARQVAEVPEVRLLLTVTGVGLLTAATIWAKLGDPGRFRGPKQVVRYAGLDPSVDPSGERDRRGPISRHGDRLLRRALIEAAWSVARHDEGELGQFFRRKAAQIGTRKAIVVLAQALDRGLADPADRGAVPGAKAARRAAEAVDAPPLDAAGCGQGGGWAAGTAGHPGPARYGIGVGSPGGSKEEGGNGVPPGGDLTSIRSEKPPAFRQGLAGRKAKNSPALTIPK